MPNPVNSIALALQSGFKMLSVLLEKADLRFYLKTMKRQRKAINAAEDLIRIIQNQGKGEQKEVREAIDEFFKYNN